MRKTAMTVQQRPFSGSTINHVTPAETTMQCPKAFAIIWRHISLQLGKYHGNGNMPISSTSRQKCEFCVHLLPTAYDHLAACDKKHVILWFFEIPFREVFVCLMAYYLWSAWVGRMAEEMSLTLRRCKLLKSSFLIHCGSTFLPLAFRVPNQNADWQFSSLEELNKTIIKHWRLKPSIIYIDYTVRGSAAREWREFNWFYWCILTCQQMGSD